MEMMKKELAELTGLTFRRVFDIDKELREKDSDKALFVPGESGKRYDLATFVQRWTAYCVQVNTVDTEGLDLVKARHEAVKMQKTQLEVDRMEGSLVDVQEVRRLWGDIANTVMTNMIHLPSTLAPMLKGMKDQAVIESVIDTEVRKVLEGLAETPLPTYIMLRDDTED